MPGPLRVLSIDGGGIRGIIPAVVLSAIETAMQQPISACFDLVAGTSTGGILALGLTVRGDDGKPKFAAAQLAQLYRDRGKDIFHTTFWQRLRSAGNLTGPRYAADGIESVLQDAFGEARLKDALTDVLVTSYEIEQLLSPFFFRSRRAKADPIYDFPIRQVARATSAAPTYFPPAKVPAQPGDQYPYYGLVDGGVFANNPSMCAFAEARSIDAARDVLLVSVGTGQATERISYDAAKGWGLAGWARPVLDVVFDGVADTVEYQLRQCLPGENQFFRFQSELTDAEDAMDDVSPGNLDRLFATGQKIANDHAADIARLCAALKAAAPQPVLA